MKIDIICPECKTGKVDFDFNLYINGFGFSCDNKNCLVTVELPKDTKEIIQF